jgi:hypothetical protein
MRSLNLRDGRGAPGFSRVAPLIYLKAPLVSHGTMEVMISPDEPPADKEAPNHRPSRSEEALRIIKEYANDLREIIKKLRRLLN